MIVGGGPAGLSVAIEARLAGADVVVIERCAGAVDKACGEGLMPAGVARLARLGVTPAASGSHPLRGVRYFDATRDGRVVAEADFKAGAGLGVRRTALSEAMRERALGLGAEVREKTEAVSYREVGGGVIVETSRGPVHGDWLVAADGLHSQLRKWAGIAATVGPARRLGIRRHFAVAPWSPYVEVWWADGAEAYVTPVGPERVGVAFLWASGRGAAVARTRPAGHADFDTLLGLFPDLAARLGPPETAVRGAGPFDVTVEAQVRGPVLLTGDAAGYTDALTGEGVSLALAEAEVLVGLCLAGRAQEWSRRWTTLTRRHRWLTRGLLAMSARPALRRLVLRGLAANPWAFRAALGVTEAGPPRLTG